MKVGSYDSFPTEKKLTLNNIIILIKSVLNKDKNHCCKNILLEKCSNQLAKRWSQFFFWQYNNVEIWSDKINVRKLLCCKETNKCLGY